ncbi:MAG: thioredoxin family protein [Arenicella sp.]
MAETNSTMMELGSKAHAFSLPDYNPLTVQSEFSWTTQRQQGLLVAFICNHCPYVVHLAERLAELGNQAQRQGLDVVAINANDVNNYVADSPENMAKFARQYAFEFPYLFDEDQQVAKAYQAACTPDFFLFDQQAALVYRGQFDASRPANGETVTGKDLQLAIDALMAGQALTNDQIASVGCNIKWIPGNEPDYYGKTSA